MDKVRVPDIDAKQLEDSLREDVTRCIVAVVEAVNQAPSMRVRSRCDRRRRNCVRRYLNVPSR